MELEDAKKEVAELKRRFFWGHPPKDPREVLRGLREHFAEKDESTKRTKRGGRDRQERGGFDRSE